MSRDVVSHQLDDETFYRYVDIVCSFWVLFCAKLRNLMHNVQLRHTFSSIIFSTIIIIGFGKFFFKRKAHFSQHLFIFKIHD